MTLQQHAIRFSFSTTLRAALRHRFGKIPSNALIAREFNLRSHSAKTISQESVRRWLLGTSLPEYSHLQVLVRWLNIDTNRLFETDHLPQHGPPQDKKTAHDPLLPEVNHWNLQLQQFSPRQRQTMITLIDYLLSANLGKTGTIDMNFSEIVSSTRAARAVPDENESIPRKLKDSNATFEKTADCSRH